MLITEDTYITDDSQVGDELQDGQPDADVLSSFHNRPAILTHKLLGVKAYLHPVINQSKEWGQGTRCYEDGDEPKLQHYDKEYAYKWKIAIVSNRPSAIVCYIL